jgi:hypothetical protein
MAQKFGKDFGTPGRVKKEYVARVSGCFPTNRTDPSIPDVHEGAGEDLVCEEPLLTIDKQIGVNVVHPDGRVTLLHIFRRDYLLNPASCTQPSKTIFKRLSYDPDTDTSVVSCSSYFPPGSSYIRN